MKKVKSVLKEMNISLYGYRDQHLPDYLRAKKDKVIVYARSPMELVDRDYSETVRKYNSTQDIGWVKADLVFLDNEAIKGVVIGYPSSIPYVLVSLGRPRYWLWLIIGITRRILNKQINIKGMVTLKTEQSSRTWLVLNSRQQSSSISLSSDIGIQGLLDHLKIEKIDYVVLRFYQKLPKLFRKGGDLDLLVSDKDYDRLKSFVLKNPGDIPLDIWSVSKPSFNGISYYLPRLAEKILKDADIGPTNSRIPNKKDSLLSLIYHALYHKGINSGILSTTHGIESLTIPENDYISEIQKMAKELGVNVGSTMEELDKYLFKEGWRPKIDTLAKIAQWNQWVKIHHFSEISESKFPFSIFILRQSAVDDEKVDKIKELILDDEFKILGSTLLLGDLRKNAILHLRGGTWKDAMFSDDTTKFEPAYAVVIADMNSDRHTRFVNLKNKVRLKFDSGIGPSVVHSTDYETEFWDYLDYCFPNEIDKIKSDVNGVFEQQQQQHTTYFKLVKLIKFFPYYKASIMSKIKEILTRIVTM